MLINERISIVGGGLVGALLSIFLAKKGFRVEVYERRPDLRKGTISAGKSINLALAKRGIHALEQVGLMDQVRSLMLPMKGRLVHPLDGPLSFQPYGQRPEELVYSIGRGDLNALLLNAAEASGKVRIHFNHECRDIDWEKQELALFDHEESKAKISSFSRLIGTDGSGSKVRDLILEKSAKKASIQDLEHGYKELWMIASPQNKLNLAMDALHIWPRFDFMMIALPNLDQSLTATLFLPKAGLNSFASLPDAQSLNAFFQRNFLDSLPYLPKLEENFLHNPTGVLATVRCPTWAYHDKAVLMGDAAHAIVPFHGQGMNCGFEDCSEFAACLEANLPDWGRVFEQFQKIRQPNCNAIADLALENYIEMRADVNNPQYLLQKKLSFKLEQLFPEQFIPRYSMVMFHRIPYQSAKSRGEIQKSILAECCAGLRNLSEVNLEKAKTLVQERLA